MLTSLGSARQRFGRGFRSRPILLMAFAFAVMADPVSSVAYAIEAALRALNGDLGRLLATMSLVVVIIALIITNYHQLVARFPEGGGAAAAAGKAFGEGWAFIPIGALIVDFVLTIAISVAAGASALIDYVPSLAPGRIPLALVLLIAVAALTWFGHIGRVVFALMTVAFVGAGIAVLAGSLHAHVAHVGRITHASGHPELIAILLAFPVAMALATGVEAPSSAIAQLAQLDNAGRRRFGRVTLWLTLGIVGTLTLGLTAAAVHLGIGIPAANSTQIGNLARASTSHGIYAFFQISTALLLLAAASSSFQAGPGLLKALSRRTTSSGHGVGILPAWMGRTNNHHTPYWAVVLFFVISALVTIAAGAHDQDLVLFYAVSVFMSFLVGLLAMARFSGQEHQHGALVMNVVGAIIVAFTLAVNVGRGQPIASVAAALIIAAALRRQWARAGKPRGISSVVSAAEFGD
ncbi:MAG: amino acid permease [Solirubrobacteraceae bacterium]